MTEVIDGNAVAEYDSTREQASVITPVSGGVGPMARATLVYNTVKAASQRRGVDVP